jgi:hypothetical protein
MPRATSKTTEPEVTTPAEEVQATAAPAAPAPEAPKPEPTPAPEAPASASAAPAAEPTNKDNEDIKTSEMEAPSAVAHVAGRLLADPSASVSTLCAGLNRNQLYAVLASLELMSEAQDAEKRPVAKKAAAGVAALISRSLDMEYNQRWIAGGGKDGVGLYAEAGPLGTLGAGVGIANTRTVNGRQVVQQSGIFLGIKADGIFHIDVPTAPNFAL